MYRYHITFENGSNPYFSFDRTEKELSKDLKKWNKHYMLKLVSTIHAPNGSTIYTFYATDK